MKRFYAKKMLRAKNMKERAAELVLDNKKGTGEFVSVAVIVIVVLVIAAFVFPDARDYVAKTIMGGVTTQTNNLFNYKG